MTRIRFKTRLAHSSFELTNFKKMKHLIKPKIAWRALLIIWSFLAQAWTLRHTNTPLRSNLIPVTTDTSRSKNMLFKIQRSKDANEIHYDIKLDNKGLLNTAEPIDVHWVKYGAVVPLTDIQKKYAYGLHILSVKPGEIHFQFVSYNKRSFILKRITANTFKVYVNSCGKQVELQRIFIQLDGGTFWVPRISKVELHGMDATGNSTTEIIKP